MEDKTEKHVYEMNVQPQEPSVTVEVKEVPIEGKPLVAYDASKKYLLQAGRTVLQKFRDFTMKPEGQHVDEAYCERNPFEHPIRRTQIPIYPEDIEGPEVEEDEPRFITTQKLNVKLNEMIQNLPDRETALEMFHERCHEMIDWSQKRITSSYEKARKLINGLRKQQSGMEGGTDDE